MKETGDIEQLRRSSGNLKFHLDAFIDGFLNGALAMDSYLFHADETLAHA